MDHLLFCPQPGSVCLCTVVYLAGATSEPGLAWLAPAKLLGVSLAGRPMLECIRVAHEGSNQESLVQLLYIHPYVQPQGSWHPFHEKVLQKLGPASC